MIHRTAPAEAAVHPSGWASLPSGCEVTRLPVIDTARSLPGGRPLFARLTYDDAIEVARRHGASLIAPERMLEADAFGLRLVPHFEHPSVMQTIEASQRHDANVWRQLDARWDGAAPVSNAGKGWVAGAPPGRARLFGWFRPQGPVQPLSVAHGSGNWHDYGTETALERGNCAPSTMVSPMPMPMPMKPRVPAKAPPAPSPWRPLFAAAVGAAAGYVVAQIVLKEAA